MNAHDDVELRQWLYNARERGGSFVKSLFFTAVSADDDNYAILRPALLQLKAKYPNYDDINIDREMAALSPRFSNVSCSQCGNDFGPGDSGVSHCENHKDRSSLTGLRRGCLIVASIPTDEA